MWEYKEFTDVFKNSSGKWYARVSILCPKEERSVFLKFQEEPTIQEIKEAAQRVCDNLNPKEEVIDG